MSENIEGLTQFRCYKCGRLLFKKKIFGGGGDFNVLIEAHCRCCKERRLYDARKEG